MRMRYFGRAIRHPHNSTGMTTGLVVGVSGRRRRRISWFFDNILTTSWSVDGQPASDGPVLCQLLLEVIELTITNYI